MGAPWRIITKLVQGPPGPPGTLKSSAAWTPGTFASGTSVSTAVTVAGAALGMAALGAFSLALPAGVVVSAAVTAANTVTVTLLNLSGAGATLAAGTVTAEVLTQ